MVPFQAWRSLLIYLLSHFSMSSRFQSRMSNSGHAICGHIAQHYAQHRLPSLGGQLPVRRWSKDRRLVSKLRSEKAG